MICKWHKCNRRFKPTHHLQKFCCKKCKLDRTSWQRSRGFVLVDMLLKTDIPNILAYRKKLLDEIRKDAPQ